MPKRSKPKRPAADVLDPAVAGPMAGAMAPVELTPAGRDAMHRRIMQRIRDEAPPGTATSRAADVQRLSVGPGVEVKSPGRR